jgi:hypothetical protein
MVAFPLFLSYTLERQETTVKLKYTYELDGEFLVGYLDDYPEHPTQAYTVTELEAALLEIYHWILDGTLETKKHGILEIAG